ncbi:MAG: type II secretion system protein [Nitrospirae bacterium]|nr:type II secretion system protein [Nitrospirota bacterium]
MKASKGFTLLEVLVALSILGIAVSVVFQVFSAGLRGIAASEDYVFASAKALSKMREFTESEKFSEKSSRETTDDGYTVDVKVSKVFNERTDRLQVDIVEIDLTVSWTKGIRNKSINFKTLKTVGKQI